jgi:hypothetical protein
MKDLRVLTTWSVAPMGLARLLFETHGSRRGLLSIGAPRLPKTLKPLGVLSQAFKSA